MGFGLNQVNNQEKQNHSGLGEPGCDNSTPLNWEFAPNSKRSKGKTQPLSKRLGTCSIHIGLSRD